MGPFLGQVGLLFLLYFVHRCCGKHQTVPYWCTYHPFFLQARLFAFLKADYAVYRCVIPRAQFRVSSISKASFSSHDVVSVVGPLTCTQKHVASHLCRPPSANQGALKIHAFEADITRNYALGHYVFQCSKAHVFTGMEYTWCHVMFRCRFLALWPAAGRVIMFIPVDSVSMYIAFLSFINEDKWFTCSDADVVTVSVYVREKKILQLSKFLLKPRQTAGKSISRLQVVFSTFIRCS